MKLSHLRYILEVAKTGSITRAAQNLYIGQPNLSKVIKDMEAELGFTVFARNSKGVVPTQRGAELILRAKELLEKADSFEEDYFGKESKNKRLSVAVCGVEQCINAIEASAEIFGKAEEFKLEYFRCDRKKALELAESGEISFAAVRDYSGEDMFKAQLSQSGLRGQKLYSDNLRILTARINKAAQKEIIEKKDLENYTEVFIYGTDGCLISESNKIAAVSDFESACKVLTEVNNSFMAISDRDKDLIGEELCIRDYAQTETVTDWAVFKEGKRFSGLESEALKRIMETVLYNNRKRS